MSIHWWYPHQDLGEPVHVDGSPIIRPVVPVLIGDDIPAVIAVLDSGSPISVADAEVVGRLGVDVARDRPIYDIPLSVGGGFERTPVFEVHLQLRPPLGTDASPIEWHLRVGARRRWRLPFAILLGQRGWFDVFPTRIDGSGSTVELPETG